jgi:hypothetical protein
MIKSVQLIKHKSYWAQINKLLEMILVNLNSNLQQRVNIRSKFIQTISKKGTGACLNVVDRKGTFLNIK